MYSQQTINWDRITAQIDIDFPVKPKTPGSTPPAQMTDWETIKRNARQIIPRRYQDRRFSESVIRWLGTPIDDSIADTTAVTAVRIGQSLSGGKLTYDGTFPIAESGDPQTYCNESGGGLEIRNAAGQIVGKFTPTVDYVSFL